jgi:hypothetical protein
VLYLGQVQASELSSLLDSLNSPHVDLAPLLGVDGPLVVGVNDLAGVIASKEPTFHLSYEDASLIVRREDGGVMATLEVKF